MRCHFIYSLNTILISLNRCKFHFHNCCCIVYIHFPAQKQQLLLFSQLCNVSPALLFEWQVISSPDIKGVQLACLPSTGQSTKDASRCIYSTFVFFRKVQAMLCMSYAAIQHWAHCTFSIVKTISKEYNFSVPKIVRSSTNNSTAKKAKSFLWFCLSFENTDWLFTRVIYSTSRKLCSNFWRRVITFTHKGTLSLSKVGFIM